LSGGLGAVTGAAGAALGAATGLAGSAAGAAADVAGAARGAVTGAAGAAAGAAGAALGAGHKMASSAVDAAGDAAAAGSSGLLKLLPLLLLALLAFLGYQYCNRPTETQQMVAATPAATLMPKINSSLSMVYGENGRVKITGVVPDQATKDAILAEAKAVYGDKFDADITVNANAQKAGWFAKLKDIFTNFNIPGAELSFDGEALKVAGVAAAAALVDKFKGLFPSFNITSAFLNIAEAAKEANAKAMAALASLSGTSSADDVVKALNLQIVNFASGKSDLPKENQDILKKAADTLKAMPTGTKIEVGGHTDNKGAAAANLKLSESRAAAVQKFLVGLGVKPDALTAKGYGPDKPVATNDTEAGRFSNRRIEFALSK
ncbi:MAG: OmpA family protein, partial [Acidobacteria bacterium]|nr:OmpA family protein [Acidobacteriota bacterium]